MVQCIELLSGGCLMLFLWSLCHAICKGNGYACTAHLCNTPDFIEGGCKMCSPSTPSPSAQLALRSDISKVYCAGGKFKLLPEYLTERDIWWLIIFKEEEQWITVTLSFFVIARIFLNRCKKVTKLSKFRKIFLLKFDFSLIKETKSKFEKKTQCYVVKQLFLFEMSPKLTM